MTSDPRPQTNPRVSVTHGEQLTRYGFGSGHPFDDDRLEIFWSAMRRRRLEDRVVVAPPERASRAEIELFHAGDYVDMVERRSEHGEGYLDHGDTPAFRGMYDAAAWVVGSTVDAVRRLLDDRTDRAFVPVAGLHHARRAGAGGFCIFNDCAVAIEHLRRTLPGRTIAYADIDAHHGDGVYYGFENAPDVVIADIHEDGRFLYPGTGAAHETGTGSAAGTKLNLPLPPGAADDAFLAAWERAEAHLDAAEPAFVILQCGADGIAGDPLTHLAYSVAAHRHATERLCRLADRHCGGRLLALGGGGYDPAAMGDAWCTVVETMLET
jgi:acetoin utilization protein AcuC